jgi:uncharacterized membrane protein YphA (DoxX/SURF4 family)
MKIAVIIVRTLMGLMFLFASVTVLFNLMPQPEMPSGDMKTFTSGLAASGYLMTFIKVTELVCALAFLSGRYVTLAAVVIFPVILNIVLTHAFLAPEGLPIAILLLAGNLFLAYYHRENYRSLFKAKSF